MRLESAGYGKSLVVLTTGRDIDDELCEHVRGFSQARIFRGHHLDVGQRFLDCIEETKVDYVFRLTADNPFVPLEVIASIINEPHGADYVSTKVGSGYPVGADVEFFTSQAFRQRRQEGELSSYDREHVTPVFYSSASRLASTSPRGVSREIDDLSTARLTVDTPEDFARLVAKSSEILSKSVQASWTDFARILT